MSSYVGIAFVQLNMVLTFQIGWWVTATLSAFLFFAFGYCAESKKCTAEREKWRDGAISGLLVRLGIAALGNGYTDMYGLISGKTYLVFMRTGILGTLLMLRFASAIVNYPRFKSACLQLCTKRFIILISICRMAVPRLLSLLGVNFLDSNIFFQIVATIVIAWEYLAVFRGNESWSKKKFSVL